jgi:hypothetical protein
MTSPLIDHLERTRDAALERARAAVEAIGTDHHDHAAAADSAIDQAEAAHRRLELVLRLSEKPTA